MRIRCMVVDDEPLARRVLQKYISDVPSLDLVKECGDAMEAAAYLHTHPVDVMFLDIQMPELTGLNFLKTLPHPPAVILTTAYSEYALEGYECSASDYLLKPVSFERFLKAVNKVLAGLESRQITAERPETDNRFVFLRADKVDHRVDYSTIRTVEGCGNFVKVFTDNSMIMVSETLSHVEERLPGDCFLRVHKSFIVALNKIEKVEGNMIRIGEVVIPIGKHYKMSLERMLKKNRLGKGKPD